MIARTCRLLTAILTGAFALVLASGLARAQAADVPARPVVVNASELARQATIRRDDWGVPHIAGPTDESVVFAFAYAQAEDFFWQVEDTYILGLGRYAEAHGPRGLNSDLLNRAFEIVSRSEREYEALEPELKRVNEAFVAGLNYYLDTHPEVKPRLIHRFEPWQMLAVGRHLTLELTFRYTRLINSYLPRMMPNISAAVGSNGWAVGPQRTNSGSAMLFVNPHQPWFGFGQFYEAHLASGEGWSFYGATFFGSPLPTVGHNEFLGWTFTTNEPDIADVWRETFDDPQHPLNYRYGDGHRTAEAWDDTVRIKTHEGVKSRTYHFLKTHHGPVVVKEDEQHRLTVRIGRMYESLLLRQQTRLLRARNLSEFKQGLELLNFPIMNVLYADRQGNIAYFYNGCIPRRDPQFDWSKPVDGSDPRTEWQGFHTLGELPQIENPASGYLQNCNSSPFTTTAGGNPREQDFPPYMVEDKHDDKRRAKRSREILGHMQGVTFEAMQSLAFDTTVYWAETELPVYAREYDGLKQSDPELARQVAPYLEHLLAWDCRSTLESTAATLCVAWYDELYGPDYPGEELRAQYVGDMPRRFQALVQAASKLQSLYGSWRVPYGKTHRIQRHADVADLLQIPFHDEQPSLPCAGMHGPMGVIFTQYYTPTINIPLLRTLDKHYGVIGPTYMAVYEFGPRIRGASVLQFGTSGNPSSPHYFDQAQLLSQQKMKAELFYPDEVMVGARQAYHPGDQSVPLNRPIPQVETSHGAKPRS